MHLMLSISTFAPTLTTTRRHSPGKMKQYIVDAFTPELFHGNPAAVCVMDQWPDEQLMMNIAFENNLSETAFIVKEAEGYHLRWFTPAIEVGLCGHATLASGFVMLNYYLPEAERVDFMTLSGKVSVTRKGDRYELTFPNLPLEKVEVTDAMVEALGAKPTEAWLSLDLTCVFDDEETVRTMRPDMQKLLDIPGRLCNVTARCHDGKHDCTSRSFAPKVGVPEDPVCGSAHCQIIPLWSQKLGKADIVAQQSSKRGGSLYCSVIDDKTLTIAGEAVLYAVSEIALR